MLVMWYKVVNYPAARGCCVVAHVAIMEARYLNQMCTCFHEHNIGKVGTVRSDDHICFIELGDLL